ncbi:MAG TPA: preprotein translocase subunit SecE [Candidatus Nitrosocosmicus sp.]|nr:preprotein translocase subunit SecE [Candidatus Nitrosocosmicus sp.]
MDETATATATADKANEIKRGNWFFETKEELTKVTWPSRKKTITLTLTVLIISLIVGAYLGIIDVLLAKLLEFLTKN